MNATAKNLSGGNSKRRTAIIVGAVLLFLALAVGGWTFFRSKPTPENSQRDLWSYLRKQAGTRDFKPDLDIATASLSSIATRAVAVTTTNKTGKVRTITKMVKTTGKAATGVIPETSFSDYFRTNQALTETYKEMYLYVGQELYLAERLLENSDPQQQLIGLTLACEASNYARTNVQNHWLSARICEGYLWPHLPLVESTNRSLLTPDAVLNVCELAFQDSGETNNIIRNYNLMLSKVSRSPAYKDLLRFRLATVYKELGENQKALGLFKEIKNYRPDRVASEIAQVEERIRASGKR